MTKKKKALIIAAAVLSVLCIAAVGAVMWYNDSPLPTVVKLMTAVKDRDVDAMLDCIEPDKAEMMRSLLSFFQIDANGLMDSLMPSSGGGFRQDSSTSVKFSGYHRDGDTAYFELKMVNKETDAVNTNRINFVRINGTWYLAFSFGG